MILYFSGTGNSAFVARRLASLLNEPEPIRLAGKTLAEMTIKEAATYNIVIWVVPVYSWGLPPVVVDFIKRAKIPEAQRARHYLVMTCGDDAGLTHRQWRRLIKCRGWNDIATWTVIMPNTYTLMNGFDIDTKEIEQQKLTAAPARISEIAKAIKTEATAGDDVITGRFPWVKSKIVYPWFKRFAMSPKPFHATNSCVSCGKCAKECPTKNIEMNDDRPQWSNNCALCLRCYHTCPVGAVQYGKATRKKGHYICPLKS